MEEIALTLGLLAAVYAAADLIGRLAFRLLFTKQEPAYVIVPVHSGESAEYAARYLAMTCRFLPAKGGKPLLLDCGLSEDDCRFVKCVCDRLQVEFCSLQEWKSGLQEDRTVVE